jgi:phage protein U
MMLGGFAFEALGFGYDTISRSVQTPWADIEVAQSLNALQWTGPTSDEITIKGVLFPYELGGQSSLDGLIALSMSGQPAMFVSGSAGSGLIHGKFTIQSVEEDRSFIAADGTPRRNAYSIRMKRYAGSGVALAVVIATLLSIFE